MTFVKVPRPIIALLAFLWGFIAAPEVHAKSPYIGNLTVVNSPEGLQVNATLINGFTRKVMEAIQSGLPIPLQYDIELKERHSVLPDENIVKRVIERSVVYNSLNKEYKFTSIQGNQNETVSLSKMRDIRDKMVQLQNIQVISAKFLKPNEEYYIRVRGQMNAKNYWFPFNYILFFIDFLNFETPWVESATIGINQFPVTDERNQKEELPEDLP